MRLLLLRPWIHDFTAYDLWIQPLGLLYLAAVLEQHGFELQYIDCLADHEQKKPDGRGKFRKQPITTPIVLSGVQRQYGRYGITPEAFRTALLRVDRPEAILVTSGMTYWYTGVQETISEVRKIFPRTRIMLGGIYPTLMPQHASRNSGADVVIDKQFERHIVSHVAPDYAGAKNYNSLNEYPNPAWHLTACSNYRIIYSSRGCPYRCTFCASDILNDRQFVQRDPQLVADEIETYYQKHGIRHFVFYDDALLINHSRHFEPLLQNVIHRNIQASFHTPNGLNAREINERVAELMFAAGFRTIRISLESVDPEIQKTKGNSKVTTRHFEHAVANLYQAGYCSGELECYLIMGLPGQTKASVRQSLRYVSDLGVVARLATFSPIPGTPEAEQARLTLGDIFLQEPLLQNDSCFALRNTSMTENDLQELKHECNAMNAQLRVFNHGDTEGRNKNSEVRIQKSEFRRAQF